MNVEMAYLLGMILGNGEVQRGRTHTRFTIDIPHKNIKTEDGSDVRIYVQASLLDIEGIIGPLLNTQFTHTFEKSSTKISFEKPNEEFVTRELLRMIGGGTRHQTMCMSSNLFDMKRDERISFMRGFADVTAYIRRTNYFFDKKQHRVYIEIPGNWDMVISIANMLKSLDIPIQNIDFGHPNCRDGNLTKYNQGHPNFWKKEHQIKIWANEFLPVGFNINHKQSALEKYAEEISEIMTKEQTHRFYWQQRANGKKKKPHPGENDECLPPSIRGRHFNSWSELANTLGYHE